jgi:hypothetical protein
MHFFSIDRGIIVAISFVLWLGAAGLVCWLLLPTQLPEERASIMDPTAVVHVQAAATPAPISVAQR